MIVRPLERFLREETGSATVLMGAAAVALAWANLSPASYADVWDTRIGLDLGVWHIEEDVRHVVNDLLMALFFYVVALEVKRELVLGSLRDRRTAAVPTAAAIGTMVGASLAYVAVNLAGDGDLRGWAIPIAADIAFALGVLALVGNRVPAELRAFMLTLAVVDDLGSIAVIALFFSTGVSLAWLAVAGAVIIAILVSRRIGIRSLLVYGLLAACLWAAVFESGVHGTVAGVVLGFLTPAVAFQQRRAATAAISEHMQTATGSDSEMAEAALLDASRLATESVSPLARMEERFHPWSAYLILPLFALANAGVSVSSDVLTDALTGPIGLGIAVGLVIGAPLGGFLFAYAIVATGPGRMPTALDWPAIGAVTPLKGIGFTIAIFISALAFDDPATQDEAKLAILVASFVSAVIGLTALLTRHALLSRRAAGAP